MRAARGRKLTPFLGLLLGALLQASQAHGQVDYSGWRIVSTTTQNEAQAVWLSKLTKDMGLELLSEVNQQGLPVDILVPGNKFSLFTGKVHGQGLQFEVNMNDVQTQLNKKLSNLLSPVIRADSTFAHRTYINLDSAPQAHGQVDYSGWRMVSIKTQDEAQSDWLSKLTDDMGLELLSEVNQQGLPVDILVPGNKFSLFTGEVHGQGLQFEVNEEDVQMQIDIERKNMPPIGRAGVFDHGTYHDLDSINAIINSVKQDYPERAFISTIGTTYEKRPIRLVKVTSGNEYNNSRGGKVRSGQKDTILFDCGIHAREWVSPATCLWILERLLTTYGKDKTVTKLLDRYDFFIIPVVNPDGYVYSRTKNRFWRKNRKPFGPLMDCTGVDPNRNFDFHFGEKGTSPYPCSSAYPGPKAFSEAETQAYRDLILKHKDTLKLVVSIHAYSQLWMTPYGFSNTKSKHHDELMRVSKIAVNAVEKVYGTKFKYGPINSIIYPVGGSSVDWIYEKVKIPMSFALELRDLGRYGFLLPPSEILPTATETWAGLAALVEAIK